MGIHEEQEARLLSWDSRVDPGGSKNGSELQDAR